MSYDTYELVKPVKWGLITGMYVLYMIVLMDITWKINLFQKSRHWFIFLLRTGIPLAISLSTVGLFYSKGTYVLPKM